MSSDSVAVSFPAGSVRVESGAVSLAAGEAGFVALVGGGREGEVYYHAPDQKTLWVNLMATSTLVWEAKGLTLTQKVEAGAQTRQTISVETESPARFTMQVRIPSWATETKVTVNGQGLSRPELLKLKAGAFFPLLRYWAEGDTLVVVHSGKAG